MKIKDKYLHICLLCAFAFQIIFMLMDIRSYGFLSSNMIRIADITIAGRFLIFIPLCIYETTKIYKDIANEKNEDKKTRHHRHHRRPSIKPKMSSSNAMNDEYRKRTFFMNTELLLEKQREERNNND